MFVNRSGQVYRDINFPNSYSCSHRESLPYFRYGMYHYEMETDGKKTVAFEDLDEEEEEEQ